MQRVAVVLLVLARSVSAQPEAPTVDAKAAAESLYKEGATQYDLREYVTAIDDFKRAYALFPEPTILFDIAQAYRMLRDCDSAGVTYRSYIREKPDGVDRDEATKRAAEMDSCAADQRREREAAARAHQLQVTTTAPTGPRYRGVKIAGLVTAGVGVAIAAAGIYFSLDASDKANQLEQACMISCVAGDVAPIDQAGQTSQDRALALYITGGGIFAIGTGMFLWATLHAGPETVRIVPTPGGATVSTTIRF